MANKVRYLLTSIFDAGTLTVSSASGAYVGTRVRNNHVRSKWRPVSLTNESLAVLRSQATAVNIVHLAGLNLTRNATLNLQASDCSASWSACPLNYTLGMATDTYGHPLDRWTYCPTLGQSPVFKTYRDPGAIDFWRPIVVFGGKMVVVGGTQVGSTDVSTSTDGYNWTTIGTLPFASSDSLQGVCVYNGLIWQVGCAFANDDNRKKVLYSADGVTWSEAGTNVFASKITQAHLVVYDSKLWCLGGNNYDNTAQWTTDGINWTVTTSSMPIAVDDEKALVYDGKMWIFGINRSLYWSTDGSTWNSAGTNVLPYASQNFNVCVYDGKMWMLGGNSFPTSVYYSTNGTTWTSHSTLPLSMAGSAMVVYKDKLWVMGSISDTSDPALVYWSRPVFRHWRMLLSDGTNNASHIEVGRIMGGLAIEPTRNIRDGFSVTTVDPSVGNRGAGQPGYWTSKNQYAQIEYSRPNLQEGAADQMRDLYKSAGRQAAFVLSLDPETRPQHNTYYVQFTGNLLHPHSVSRQFDVGPIDLEEKS